jgi:DNA-binding LacI/PurR family transcriptional regulator
MAGAVRSHAACLSSSSVGLIGDDAANCLLEELAGVRANAIIELPIELVARKSSARIA